MSVNNNKYQIIAPQLNDGQFSNAFILGNIAWLFMNSKTHHEMPMLMMPSQILPAIANKQYVLGLSETGTPLFYMAWANFSAETEAQYIQKGNMALTSTNWNDGDRPWILFWIAPGGHSQFLTTWIAEHLFPNHPCVRFLYHQGKKRGLRVMSRYGVNCCSADNKVWAAKHPLLINV